MSKKKPNILCFNDINESFKHSQLMDLFDVSRKVNFYDFGKGVEPAHRHPNGGGIIANSAYVDNCSHIASDCIVSGSVVIKGVVSVIDGSTIEGNVVITGSGRGVVVDDFSSLSEDVSILGSYSFKEAHVSGKHVFKNTGKRSVKHFKLFRF
jgi:UDP-3-O-[3-hydroxymyristoyl] glucosamine N-acyltransferase